MFLVNEPFYIYSFNIDCILVNCAYTMMEESFISLLCQPHACFDKRTKERSNLYICHLLCIFRNRCQFVKVEIPRVWGSCVISEFVKMTKSKNKNCCTKWKLKHQAPTGEKCKNSLKYPKQPSPPREFPKDVFSSDTESTSDTDTQDMKLSKLKKKCQKKTVAGIQKHAKGKHTSTASSSQQSESDMEVTGAQDVTENVQQLILQQLQCVNDSLDKVEHRMDQGDQTAKAKTVKS